MATKFNPRAPSVKRIVQELREISADDNPDILAEALEDNIFEWHFVIRGAWDTEFEGGVYHGRILMPAEYPFKPPAFVMLTPSGRFETGTKICLSISSHHPESWQPSWSVRSALVALIAFMQTPGNGAVGSLDHPTHARRQMAAESRGQPPKYGNAERQELIGRMHARMLELEPASRSLYKQEAVPTEEGASAAATEAAAQQEQQAAEVQQPEFVATPAAAAEPATTPASPASPPAAEGSQAGAAVAVHAPAASSLQEPSAAPPTAAEQQPLLAQAPAPAPALAQAPAAAHHASWEDRGLTYLALLLGVLLVALVIRKVLVALAPFGRGDDAFAFNQLQPTDLEL